MVTVGSMVVMVPVVVAIAMSVMPMTSVSVGSVVRGARARARMGSAMGSRGVASVGGRVVGRHGFLFVQSVVYSSYREPRRVLVVDCDGCQALGPLPFWDMHPGTQSEQRVFASSITTYTRPNPTREPMPYSLPRTIPNACFIDKYT